MALKDAGFRERQAIRELIGRYFYGVDSRNHKLVLSCFTDDAVYEFVLERQAFRGRSELARLFPGADGTHDKPQMTSHVLSCHSIIVNRDCATADIFAVAHLVNGAAGDNRILIRGLRYMDDVRRTGSGWRIARRRHQSLWQFAAEQMSPDMSGKIPYS